MSKIDPDYYGMYIEERKWSQAILAINVGISRDPDDPINYFNRAICFLGLHQLQDALGDFQKAYHLAPDNDGYSIFMGITLWWLNRFNEAIVIWKKALSAKFTDAAGGVEIPALLLFAAIRLSDHVLEKEATILLRKHWKPKLNMIWPGPIAGYLLGKLPEKAFLVTQTFADPILESQRRCKAHFWVAINAFRTQNLKKYFKHLRSVIKDPPKGHFLAVVLEQEYWLARAELEFQNEGQWQ
jgi:tetratricopeptide (TPR) repeat protein